MSDSRLTDERLKSHLNSRQPDRERMCLALLSLDRSYTRIEPRRPEGGPDGGRDLQCIFEHRLKCFGAVGFKNNANDSNEQRREISKKFKDDLSAAIDADASVKAFVFFTNVDLTPAEQEGLKQHARSCGMEFVDVLYRERLRILLDSVGGYAIRLSFLDIALSDAEQKDFFSRFGDAIQDVVVGKLEAVEHRMEEILYRNWLRGRCRNIRVNVKLMKTYRVEGSNHQPYRFALRLHRVLVYGEGELLLGCYSDIHQSDRSADFEVKKFIYSDSGLLPNERKEFKHFPSGTRVLHQHFDSIEFGIAVVNASPVASDYGLDINELGQYAIDFYCDADWVDKVRTVEVWYDDYLVHEFKNEGRIWRHADWKHGIHHWPDEAHHLKDRPVQIWDGGLNVLDRLCERKRISER